MPWPCKSRLRARRQAAVRRALTDGGPSSKSREHATAGAMRTLRGRPSPASGSRMICGNRPDCGGSTARPAAHRLLGGAAMGIVRRGARIVALTLWCALGAVSPALAEDVYYLHTGSLLSLDAP